MLDVGLLVSGIAIVAVVWAAARWTAPGLFERNEVIDRLTIPLIAGVLAGRLAAVVLDDSTSLGSIRVLLVIRGGVEFWPGVAAAGLTLMIGLRRSRCPQPALYAAALVPYLLWVYATYEVTCLLRDGCYGPASPVGLVPDGLSARQFPVGVAAGLAVGVLGLVVHRLWALSPVTKIAVSVGGVAAIRAVASIWLPRLDDGLTRQHLQSVAVAVTVAAGLGVAHLAKRVRAGHEPPTVESAPSGSSPKPERTGP